MRIRAEDLLPASDMIKTVEDLDTVLSLTLDDALKLALANRSGDELAPEWYSELLSKLGDSEKNAFTLSLAEQGVKVKASTDLTETIKQRLLAAVEQEGYVSQDVYRNALWDNLNGVDVPEKVVTEVNGWIMANMIPVSRSTSLPRKKKLLPHLQQPKKDITPEYEEQVKRLVKKPDIRKVKGSTVIAQVALDDTDKRVVQSFAGQKADQSGTLITDGKTITLDGILIASWDGGNVRVNKTTEGNQAKITQVVDALTAAVPQNKVIKEAQYQPKEFGRTIDKGTGLPDRLVAEDMKAIEAFVTKQDQRGEWLSSIDGTLWCKTGDGKIATPENSEFIATRKGGSVMYNPTPFRPDNFEAQAIAAVKNALKHGKGAVTRKSWKPLPELDFAAIKSFLKKRPASGESVNSDGELLKVQTDHHEKTLARWRGDKLTTEPPETQFEDVVLSWLFRWEQAASRKVAQDFSDRELNPHTKMPQDINDEDKEVVDAFLRKERKKGEWLLSYGEGLESKMPPRGTGTVIYKADYYPLARWFDDTILISPTVVIWVKKVLEYLKESAPKGTLVKEGKLRGKAQATDFAMEQSALEQALSSWEPKLKDLKDWLARVRQAKGVDDLRAIWDDLWQTKEDIAVEINPSKHDFKEFVELEGGMEKHSVSDQVLLQEIDNLKDILGPEQLLDEVINKLTDVELDEILEDVISMRERPPTKSAQAIPTDVARTAGASGSDLTRMEKIKEKIGADELLEAVFQALSVREARDMLDHVARTWDLLDLVRDDDTVEYEYRYDKEAQAISTDTAEVNLFQSAYAAVGGKVKDMVEWLKLHGIGMEEDSEIQTEVEEWLEQHKKTSLTDPVENFDRADRYKEHGIDYPGTTATKCKGKCDGTGFIPVHADEENPSLKKKWEQEEEKEHSKDGWHFVPCPDCKGTGKVLSPEGSEDKDAWLLGGG